MGLLDGILSNVAGSVLSGGQAQGTGPLDALVNSLGAGHQKGGADLVGAVMAMVQQNGGLPGVIEKLRASGLAQQADSWVGTGANEPISGADVRKVVGDEQLAEIASQLGVSEDEAAAAVAQLLPAVVDKVSPDGELAPDDELESAFEALEQSGGGS